MKFKQLVLALAVGATLATSAFADQTFYLYGSTAYRKATFVALNALLSSGSLQFDAGGIAVSTVSTPIATPTSAQLGSTNYIWKGQMTNSFGTQNITIYANWAGSVGGIRSLADPSFAGAPYLTDGGPYDAAHLVRHAVSVAMSDCDQISTPFDPSVDPSMNPLSSTLVSVLEFVWAKGNGTLPNVVNVNPWSLQALLSLGSVPASQFSGVPSDATNSIFLTGRDNDSGTRVLALTDCFYGTATVVNQFELPANNSYSFVFFGNSGYSSGGSVATALAASHVAGYHGPGSTNESYLMAYISVTDALNVPGLGNPAGSNTLASVTSAKVPTSQWLNYNGVTWSEPAIIEGAYTYFGYEHLFTPKTPTAAVSTFAAALSAAQIQQAGSVNVPGTMPITLMDIQQRPDGTVIAHN